MPKDRELEWNLGAHRIHFIGEVVSETRRRYAQAQQETTIENVDDYATMLDTLYMEIFPYIKDEDKSKEIEENINEAKKALNGPREAVEHELLDALNTLRDTDKDLQKARIEANLDIPSSTKLDPETALVDGLR